MRRFDLRTELATIAAAAFVVLAALAHPCAAGPACDDPEAAYPWIEHWLGAWDLASREILHLPDAPTPNFVFFDSACVYTTSDVTAPNAVPFTGPGLGGGTQTWRAAAHRDSLELPDGRRVEVALMSFAAFDRETGPFFVMAAPSYWRGRGIGQEPGLTAVFLHELAHTRQMRGLTHVIGPIDSTWKGEQELDDDAVQRRFGKDSTYVREYLAERDSFYRAAFAESISDVRAIASRALAMMRARHARWFTGPDSVYAIVDDTFLSLEGAGQWTAAAWLSHPKGGGMTRAAAMERMVGKRRWWSQDESLAIFLVLERLDPTWPSRVFSEPSSGVLALLDRAVSAPRGAR
jgi:hypothetical protein